MKKYLYEADILMPKTDLTKWSVIACDQYTSDDGYWSRVKENVSDYPSTLNLVLPEIYLDDSKQRIININDTMKKYLDDGVFQVKPSSMIYVERKFKNNKIRHGIVGMINLEDYDYNKGSKSLTRATEETVIERIPPRVEIRKDALIELPHILLFIDDPDNKVIGNVQNASQCLEVAYDFELMENAGTIKGYYVNKELQDLINEGLDTLVKDGLLFAVGDGNHSLATAKECHKINNTESSKFALVEVVNIHDSSIEFEPIYRVLFGANKNDVINAMKEYFNFTTTGENSHSFEIYDNNGCDFVSVEPISKLPVGSLQIFLDKYLKEHENVKIDYIHGIEDTKELCKKENTVGFIFVCMKKSELFDAVVLDGSLPRKTFSMGTADEKRFYLEGRRIK